MRIIADVHISPSTVHRLNELGHDAVRVNAVMSSRATDQAIAAWARENSRVVLTQDLDFSDIIALSGVSQPSVVTLRLSDSKVDNVNRVLESVLPELESCAPSGFIATVEDGRIRVRRLPIY